MRYVIVVFSLLPYLSNAQKEDTKNTIIEKRIEYLVELGEESDVDYNTVFDQLLYYLEHPLNLNKAEQDDLERLNLLNSIQINYLLEHIEKNGKLLALEELQTIQGFDLELIERIFPFVKLSTNLSKSRLSWRSLVKDGGHELVLRSQRIIEEKKGFSPIEDNVLMANPNSRYLGSEDKLYTRYRYKYGNMLSVGFTAEKDAGEQFFRGTQRQGFDFYSAHFFLRNQGKMKQLAVGDFQAQFGQGLTYWSGITFGKTADITLIKRNGMGLKPYTSVDESLFLRGGGATFEWGKINITGFYSYRHIDANINPFDSTGNDKISITSLQQTGLHRTINEIEDKDAIVQQQLGGHLAYKTRTLKFGFTSIYSGLDANFNPNLQVYSQFRNTANQQSKIGFDYNWVYKNVNLFGEFSQSIDAGYAYVSGALIALDPRLSLAVLYRNYQKDFQPISSAGLGENTTNENEKGLYMGLVAQPFNKISVSAYYDQFTFPWLRFGIDAPSHGYQYLTQLTYKPSKKLEMYLRIREKKRNKNSSIDDLTGLDYLVNEKQTNYRFNYSYKVSNTIKLKGRVELTNYDLEELSLESGHLIYQDLIYSPKKSHLSFSFRYGIFDTESFDSRIYAYESDMLYSFSIPAYFSSGTRAYLTLRYKFLRGVDIWLRYSLTYYDDLDVISSGLEEIQSNHKQEVKTQVKFRF